MKLMASMAIFVQPVVKSVLALVLVSRAYAAMTRGFDIEQWQKRDVESTVTVFVAPDQTCGYAGGNSDSSVMCQNSLMSCVFVSTKDQKAYANCCSDFLECAEDTRTTCINRAEAVSLGYCDSTTCTSFSSDPRKKYCTETDSPYCGAWTFVDWNAIGVNGCKSFRQTADIVVLTTYAGQRDQVVFSTLVITPARTSSSSTATVSSSGSVGSTGVSQNGSDKQNTESKPIGVIIGGTVGGIAVIALLSLLTFLLVRNRKRESAFDGRDAQMQQPVTQPIPTQDLRGTHGFPPRYQTQTLETQAQHQGWQQQQQQPYMHSQSTLKLYQASDSSPSDPTSPISEIGPSSHYGVMQELSGKSN